MISTVVPESRHAHKSTSRRQDGFTAHVVLEPDTGIITACALTKASGAGHPATRPLSAAARPRHHRARRGAEVARPHRPALMLLAVEVCGRGQELSRVTSAETAGRKGQPDLGSVVPHFRVGFSSRRRAPNLTPERRSLVSALVRKQR